MPPTPKRRSSRRSAAPERAEAEGEQRLQKVLAAAGISSRRECEELIREGRVEVDRQVVTELGLRVDPARQEIRVDGSVLPKPKLVHYVLNKPPGVVSTNRDPAGRPRVVDLVPSDQRLFPVGRLDRSSDGLILVTNDGELANLLTHPRYGIEKTYAVRVAGQIEPETLRQLRKGVHLAEGTARVNSVRIKRRYKQSTDLEIVLNEGRNREIRRILARVGHKVLKLTRIAIGPLRLGEMPPGAYRRLSPQELRELEDSARQARRAGETRGGPPREHGSRQRLDRLKTRPAKKSAAERPAERSAEPSRGKTTPARPRGKRPAGGLPRKKAASGRSRPARQPQQGSILDYDDAAIHALIEGREPQGGTEKQPQKQDRRRPAKGTGKRRAVKGVGKDRPATGTGKRRSAKPPRGKRKKGN